MLTTRKPFRNRNTSYIKTLLLSLCVFLSLYIDDADFLRLYHTKTAFVIAVVVCVVAAADDICLDNPVCLYYLSPYYHRSLFNIWAC